MTSVISSPQRSSSSSFGSDLLEAELEKCLEDSLEAADSALDRSATDAAVGHKRIRDDAGSTWGISDSSRELDAQNSRDAGNRGSAAGPLQQASKRARSDTPVCPPHPGVFKGLCISCGQAVDNEEEGAEGLALRHIDPGLHISHLEADRHRQQDMQRMLASRRLVLVLDLDHTLLNSARESEISAEHLSALQTALQAPTGQGQADLHHLPHMGMWTKLRPGVRQLLTALAPLYELWVYTHGDRDYAQEMGRLLDPGRSIFGSRIISAEDSTNKGVKDLDIVLGNEAAVAIVDDTAGVWPRHAANLVQVERYIYFPVDAVRFETLRPARLEQGSDESGTTGALHSIAGVLQQAHALAFAQAGSEGGQLDIRPQLTAVKRTVLAGCSLVFSKVIPLDMAHPERHALWQRALQLGASMSRSTDAATTTHVVAAGDKTDKVLWARRRNVHAVSPAWLHATALQWRRAEEGAYPVLSDTDGEDDKGKTAGLNSRSAEEDAAIAIKAAGAGRLQGLSTSD